MKQADKPAEKKVYLIASEQATTRARIAEFIKEHYSESTIFFATSYNECQQKIRTAPPQVFISDYQMPKVTAGQQVELVLADPDLKKVALIILGSMPEKETFLDELITGRVQFIEGELTDAALLQSLEKANHFAGQTDASGFLLEFIDAKQTLIRAGDQAKQVYILKSGLLQVYLMNSDGSETSLGEINPGEFVGEMAFFSGGQRSANVRALVPSEVIEIPHGTFEKILYARPAWTKKIMETLSKRLKERHDRLNR